jgi:hypothetical protein
VTVTFLDAKKRGYLASPDSSVVCDGDGAHLAFVSVPTQKFVSKSHWW